MGEQPHDTTTTLSLDAYAMWQFLSMGHEREWVLSEIFFRLEPTAMDALRELDAAGLVNIHEHLLRPSVRVKRVVVHVRTFAPQQKTIEELYPEWAR